METQSPPERPGAEAPQRAITRGIIALYKEYTGRGPTSGRAYIGDDVVTVVLEDSLLKAEQSLVRADKFTTVRRIRRDFQETMKQEIIALVERTLDRKVLCLLSDHNPDPDYAVEVLILEPEGRDRAGDAAGGV